MKKNILLIIINILYLNVLHAQYTAIPDTNFKQALVELGIDNEIDNQVLTTDINTLTDLNIIYKNISDLTGIQDFVSLTSLNCAYNNLT
ncbi:MAG: T9SS C-terminal target domain-containing protein, partial [Bacteroidetes bacterium]